jgi:hypothetical protein
MKGFKHMIVEGDITKNHKILCCMKIGISHLKINKFHENISHLKINKFHENRYYKVKSRMRKFYSN